MRNIKRNKLKGGNYFKLRGSKIGLITIGTLLFIISLLLILAFVVHDQ